jgi:hypothetical protein
VRIAKARGAYVIGTASAGTHELLRGLGAEAANRASGTAALAGPRFVPGFCCYNNGNPEQITSPGVQTGYPGHPARDGRQYESRDPRRIPHG